MPYTPNYPGGWRDRPDTTTPITAAALDHIEGGIVAAQAAAEDALEQIGDIPEGPEGPQGEPGADGADAYEVAVQAGFVGTKEEWLESLQGADGAPGADGADGRPVELRSTASQVQWRYDGDLGWIDLVSIETLTGPAGEDGDDGESPELRISGGFVQWRLPSEGSWTNLIAVADITGPQGDQGEPGADGTGVTILGSYESVQDLENAHPTGSPGDAYLVDGDLYVWSATDAAWVNVGTIQGPQGEPGSDGAAGAEVELQTTATHLQWRHVGDSSWANLVALADITGPQGDEGPQGEPGQDAENTVELVGNAEGPIGWAGRYATRSGAESDAVAEEWPDGTLVMVNEEGWGS